MENHLLYCGLTDRKTWAKSLVRESRWLITSVFTAFTLTTAVWDLPQVIAGVFISDPFLNKTC